MSEKIVKFLNEHYLIDAEGHWGYQGYALFGTKEEEEWESTHIEAAIRLLFIDSGFTKGTYFVKRIGVYDSPEIVAYTVSISWIENGELMNLTFPAYC